MAAAAEIPPNPKSRKSRPKPEVATAADIAAEEVKQEDVTKGETAVEAAANEVKAVAEDSWSAVARAISRPAFYLTPMTGGSHQTEGVKGRGLQGQDVAVFGDPDQGFDASFTIYETCAFVRSCDIGNTPYGGLKKGQKNIFT